MLDMIGAVLKEEWQSSDTPVICMNIPLKSKELSEYIYHFLKGSDKPFRVRQLIAMNQNPEKFADANYNLKIFNRILPLIMTLGEQYEPHFCYTKCDEEDSYPFLWPFYIITQRAVLMISADAASAYLQKEEGIRQQYEQKFLEIYENTEKIVDYCPNSYVAFQKYLANYSQYGSPSYSIENAPCMISAIDQDIFERFASNTIKQVPQLYEGIQVYLNNAVKTGFYMEKPITSFFSQRGVIEFLEEGKLYDKMGCLEKNIDQATAVRMLEKCMEDTRKSKMEVNMILDSKFKMPDRLMIEVFGHQAVNLFFVLDEQHMSFLEFHEKSICEAFGDFCEYLKENELSVNEEETFAFVEKQIERYKQMLPKDC